MSVAEQRRAACERAQAAARDADALATRGLRIGAVVEADGGLGPVRLAVTETDALGLRVRGVRVSDGRTTRWLDAREVRPA